MTDAPPHLVLGPDLLAHMREHPGSDLTKASRAYIQLAVMFNCESDLSNLEPGGVCGPRLSPSEMAEFTRELQSINERHERMLAEDGKSLPPL